MWYFTWILGLAVAVLFAVVNAVWLEVQDDNDWHDERLQGNADKSSADAPHSVQS